MKDQRQILTKSEAKLAKEMINMRKKGPAKPLFSVPEEEKTMPSI
jgi:hypothetical protein